MKRSTMEILFAIKGQESDEAAEWRRWCTLPPAVPPNPVAPFRPPPPLLPSAASVNRMTMNIATTKMNFLVMGNDFQFILFPLPTKKIYQIKMSLN